jgi:hypothetical protein
MILTIGLLLFTESNGFSLPMLLRRVNDKPYLKIKPACMNAPTTVSNNEELLPGIAAIQEGNNDLLEKLEALQHNPYFRFYSVDILGSCEYMPQDLIECFTESCEIYPVDEDKVCVPFVEKTCGVPITSKGRSFWLQYACLTENKKITMTRRIFILARS